MKLIRIVLRRFGFLTFILIAAMAAGLGGMPLYLNRKEDRERVRIELVEPRDDPWDEDLTGQ
jgi:hypothetical protein